MLKRASNFTFFFSLECFSRHQGFILLSPKGAFANDLTYFEADKTPQRTAQGFNVEPAVGCWLRMSNSS